MASLHSSYSLSPSSYLRTSTKMASRHISPSIHGAQGRLPNFEARSRNISGNRISVRENSRLSICCANMAAGMSGDSKKFNVDNLINKAKTIWVNSPEPVKKFPWNRAMENFIQLILDLTVSVIKYLSLPLLAVTSLSEMSYCAHHKKLSFVPFPLLAGVVVAGILQETVLELSPLLKDAEVPWHLIASAVLFTLIKLPGPYYPFWGRIFIPHFANGVLWRTAWSVFLWYRRPRKTLGEISPRKDA